MSTIQEQLVTKLAGIATNGLWAMTAPDGTAMPYMTYQRITNATQNVLAGNGNPPIQNEHIQIDIYAATYGGCQAVAAAVKAAMLTWTVQNTQLLEYDLYEDQVKAFRVLMEYSVWL